MYLYCVMFENNNFVIKLTLSHRVGLENVYKIIQLRSLVPRSLRE